MIHSPDPGRADGLRGWVGRLRSITAADDERVVFELYHEYHRPLLAFVTRLTDGDRQWAEDVVQETMVRAWRSMDTLTPEGTSLMPWLATVARRVVIDHRRRRNARPHEVGDAGLGDVPVSDEMEDLLRSLMVSEALRALTPAHREVLNETILRGRTVNECAQMLGIPVGTVKSRVYYALRALKVVLEEMGVTR
jgi:RNA polymerase sigma-70 factor, ECF subfamily